jgi:hypothetical protein
MAFIATIEHRAQLPLARNITPRSLLFDAPPVPHLLQLLCVALSKRGFELLGELQQYGVVAHPRGALNLLPLPRVLLGLATCEYSPARALRVELRFVRLDELAPQALELLLARDVCAMVRCREVRGARALRAARASRRRHSARSRRAPRRAFAMTRRRGRRRVGAGSGGSGGETRMPRAHLEFLRVDVLVRRRLVPRRLGDRRPTRPKVAKRFAI